MKCNGLREEESLAWNAFEAKDVLGRGNLPADVFPRDVEMEVRIVGAGLGMRAVTTCPALCESLVGDDGRCFKRKVLRNGLANLSSQSNELVELRRVLKKRGDKCWVNSQANRQVGDII